MKKIMRSQMGKWSAMIATAAILLAQTAVMAAERVATPRFSPPGGTYVGSQSVEISCSTPEALIRYSTDGSMPNMGSKSYTYTGPIDVTNTMMLNARAFKKAMPPSATEVATYVITAQPSVETLLSPTGGTYSTDGLWVAISSTETNVIFRYTLDGSNPTVTSPIAVSNQVRLAEISATLKARAFRAGAPVGAIVSGYFVVFSNVPLPLNVPIYGLSGALGSQQFYVTTITSSNFFLYVYTTSTNGGSGDCDLYLKYGARPTTSNYWGASQNVGPDEHIDVYTNTPGSWYIMLYGNNSYSNMTLKSYGF